MVSKAKTIAIIPARGGSKRIPRKNIIDFNGQPMISWTIKAAIESDLFSEVHVSTEDPEIANIALRCGAKVPFLRGDCFDNHSGVSDVIAWHLAELNDNSLETVVMLMPNCPLRSDRNIIDMFNEYSLTPGHSIISAFRYGFCNPWWAHKIQNDGTATPLFSESCKMRSQDLDILLCPTGAIWISNIVKLQKEKTFYSDKYRLFEIPLINAVDIDDYDDLRLAKALCPKLKLV